MNGKRIRVIIGHYGSGKTEFAVNFAIKLAEEKKKTAIIDLDVVNPYFRSREKEDMFKGKSEYYFDVLFAKNKLFSNKNIKEREIVKMKFV